MAEDSATSDTEKVASPDTTTETAIPAAEPPAIETDAGAVAPEKPAKSRKPRTKKAAAAKPAATAADPEPDSTVEEVTPKKRAARKTAAKSASATKKAVAEKPKAPRKQSARKKTEATQVEASTAPQIPVADVETPIEDPAPAIAPVDESATGVPELTESTKRRRKPRSEVDGTEATSDATGEATEEADEKPAKRRTAANAKTAPRTRKVIKPGDSTGGEPASDPEEAPARKRRATKATTAKSAPKPRSRKPATPAVEAPGEPLAVPDPSAPSIDDERPLVLNTDIAIAEDAVILTEETKRPRKPRNASLRSEATAVSAPPAETVEPAPEAAPAASDDGAVGSNRTVIAPAPASPSVIEPVASKSSKGITMIILFVIVGVVGLGAGWLLGSTTDKPTSVPEPSGTATNNSTTGASQPPTDFSASGGLANPAPTGNELMTLSGSAPRQSALFDLPATTVQLHYDSTVGIFTARLLPEGGGDGTVFSCSAACNKEQAISAPPGRYYFEIQSSGGDWNIRINP